MKIFSLMYEKTLYWARHRYAVWYLAALSFAESSFFPIPPDVMLAPMVLAKPQRAWHYALITTVASVLGGVFGYLVGMFAFDLIQPWLHQFGYWDTYLTTVEWFSEWGFWVVILAGFSPIPYKVFTVAAGTVSMVFIPFLLASLIGRGGRFFLVAGLIWWGGERMERLLRSYIDWLGWLFVILAVVLYFVVTVIKS